MEKIKNSAIGQATRRLEQKRLPTGFETRLMTRIEKQQRREELADKIIFAVSCVASIALLAWGITLLTGKFDFKPDQPFDISWPSFEFSLPRLDFEGRASDHRLLYIVCVAIVCILSLDTYIRHRIYMRKFTKNNPQKR